MAKIVKITKSSWQLGWIDGLERKVGRCLIDGVDSEAYWGGIERARAFIKAVSVTQIDILESGSNRSTKAMMSRSQS